VSRSTFSSQPSQPSRQFVPWIALLALIAVGWAAWLRSSSAAPEIVQTLDTPAVAAVSEATAEAKPALPEVPVSALLPANDLTDERLAAYWGLTVETIGQLHDHRSLTNERLAEIPPERMKRQLWRIEHPKADHPGEAMEWRLMRQRDENGRIRPDGLINAIRQHETRLGRQAAGNRAAGLPAGPLDTRPGAANAKAGLSTGGWIWLGPGNIGGRSRSLVSPNANPNTLYVATVGGGIWRTTNGGASWAALPGFSANLAATTLAIHPTTQTTIYCGTGEGFFNGDALQGAGIFRTTDGGTTWTQLASTNNANFQFVNRVAISADGSTILAATNSGLFRSTDGGTTFNTPSGGVNTRMLDVDFHPTDSTRCICSTSGARVWHSSNSGATFTASTGLSSTTSGFSERAEVCYARANGSTVYASVDRNNGTVFRSTDGGQTFSQRSVFSYLSGQGWYNNIIWAGDPTNADRVVAGGLDNWKSTDGGANFTQISVWFNAPASSHADNHFWYATSSYNGTGNQSVYVANDGGVYRADNLWGTVTWQELNNNLGVTQFYGGSGNPTNGVYYGGTQDNGTLKFTPGGTATETWSTPFGGDGGFSASDPTDPNYHYNEYVYLQIHRSTNGGASASYIWNGIGDAGSAANFIAPFILDPSNPNRMLAGGARLWRSDNVKATTPTWASIKPSVGSNISAICVNPTNSDQVWVGHNNGDLFYSTDATVATPTWTKLDIGLPNRYLERIAVDPTNGNTVYVSFGGFSAGNLWRSTNAGASWTDVSVGLPAAPINGLAIHPTMNTWIYAGTEVGVYGSEDSGATWSATSEGPVKVAVDELTFVGPKLLAVTHGRGMYEITPSTSGGGGGGGGVLPPPAGGLVLVAWNAASRTLTITGDAKNNVLTATWRSDRITVQGSQDTRIQVGTSQTTSVTFNTGTAAININGDLKDGNDFLTIVSVPITTLSPRLGNGNDKLSLSYCTVKTAKADGGAGTDTFVSTASTISSNQNVSFP
jgi:hypothetical protein